MNLANGVSAFFQIVDQQEQLALYTSQTGTNQTAYNKYKTAFKNSALNDFGESAYGLVDFKCYLTKLSSQFTSVSTDSVLTALNNMVMHNSYCSDYNNKPCGVSAFFPLCLNDRYYFGVGKSDYAEGASKFTGYREMCYNYGSWDF